MPAWRAELVPLPLLLTADLGNSALKLLSWETTAQSEARPIQRWTLARDGRLPDAFAAVLAQLGALDGAALSSVAEEELERAVCEALLGALGGRSELCRDPLVDNRCREPRTTGADRLFAARGAFELGLERALILDAGTALTIDAFLVRGGRPTLLGGAIAPGPTLLAAALAGGTARLAAIEPRAGVPALGRDTRGALEAGVAIGFRGAARELARRIADEAELGDAPALLTGGAAAFLDDPALFPGGRLRVEPDLVHRGLLGALRASEDR